MSNLGRINPLPNSPEQIEQKKKPTNQPANNFGFASALEKAIGENEQESFIKEINSAEHLQERIEHYQSFATSEEQKMYVEMLKYYKENNQS